MLLTRDDELAHVRNLVALMYYATLLQHSFADNTQSALDSGDFAKTLTQAYAKAMNATNATDFSSLFTVSTALAVSEVVVALPPTATPTAAPSAAPSAETTFDPQQKGQSTSSSSSLSSVAVAGIAVAVIAFTCMLLFLFYWYWHGVRNGDTAKVYAADADIVAQEEAEVL